jgi:hypothetical protein
MKKIFSLLIIPFIFSGCFGGDGDGDISGSDLGKITYNHSKFTIDVPQDWEIIEESDFTSNVPSETVVGFRSNIQNEIFTANVNISMINLGEGISSSDFATSSKSKASSSLLSFEEVSTEKIEIPYGENIIEGVVLEFSGKKNASDPIIQFKQLFVVHGSTGYIVGASHMPEEDDTVVKYMDEMLNSFVLK